MIPIVEENGKKVFIGQEDPSNPPVFVKNPLSRYCSRGHENSNDTMYCKICDTQIEDGKMQCPICQKFFDYLLGEDIHGGKRGCESCWKPPERKE